MDHDLDRFLTAQAPVYEHVLAELRLGRKERHWMWFIFPQVAGLGSSPTSVRYAIRSLDEARAYLRHPLLGARLRECARLVAAARASGAEGIFGSIDARKLRSSMTLFHRVDPGEPAFREVLDRWFGGGVDPATDLILAGQSERTPGS